MTWAPTATLAELAAGGLFSDGDWVESKDQDPSGSVRLTQLADIGVGEFRDRSDRWLRIDQAAALRCTFLEPGDVLIARMPDPIGRACLAPPTIGTAVTAVDVSILRIRRPDIDPRYVMWAINAPRFHAEVEARQSGTTRKRISRKNLGGLAIPLPPLDEQRRTIELLEDHLSRLDAAATYLDAALRRATTLIDQILDNELAVKEAKSVSLGGLLTVGLANGKSVPTEDGGFPVLRLTALRDGRIDLDERKAGAWSATDADRFLVKRGDFLIARGNGSLRLVGRGGLVTDDPDPVAYPDTLIRARPDSATISSEFLALVWNAPAIRRQIERAAKTTAGIYKINQKDVAAVQVPVPALIDQERIVRAVTAVRESMATLASEIGRSRTRSAALRRSLLTAAFSDQLTA